MKKTILLRRFLAIGAILLFLFVGTISATESNKTVNYGNNRDDVTFLIFGTLGDNQWYISDVEIYFDYDPERVDEIHYFLYGEWHEYNDEGVVVSEDGAYSIQWYWIDLNGETNYGPRIEFKIDKSPPTIKLTKKIEASQLVFNAACSDGTSLVEKVEFYLDDELIETDIDGPYSYTWIGAGLHEVYAIGYNYAGLTEQSETLDTTAKPKTVNYQLFEIILQRIYNIFLLFQHINIF